ncbi:hypothetical protein [Endozoicomonas arenosclerae]|uniref:hypothetical protein n=1 Tax=Endozoicomonas arenosclerae TaxID=1633495 RepID=UPI000AD433D3|nr:hypothetical protein [Endozoicomonas arenosclerae]
MKDDQSELDSNQEQQNLMALLRILAIGQRQIERGDAQIADNVFKNLKQKIETES